MKQFYRPVQLILFVVGLALALSACKETITVVPLPEQSSSTSLAGDYTISGIESYTIEGAVSSQPVTGMLTVYAGSYNAYFFQEKLSGKTSLAFMITRKNDDFSLQSVSDNARVGSTTYYGNLTSQSRGKIDGETIEYDRYASPSSAGLTAPDGTRITYSMKIQKHVHLIAKKLH